MWSALEGLLLFYLKYVGFQVPRGGGTTISNLLGTPVIPIHEEEAGILRSEGLQRVPRFIRETTPPKKGNKGTTWASYEELSSWPKAPYFSGDRFPQSLRRPKKV